MALQKFNGWRWTCNQCPHSGFAHLKKDAKAAQDAHEAMHAPVIYRTTLPMLTWNGPAAVYGVAP